MRMSDWSSDVCSSDLARPYRGNLQTSLRGSPAAPPAGPPAARHRPVPAVLTAGADRAAVRRPAARQAEGHGGDGAEASAESLCRRPAAGLSGTGRAAQAGRPEAHTTDLQPLMRISSPTACFKKQPRL